MSTLHKILTLITFSALLSFASLHASQSISLAAKFESKYNFRTIETEHFFIHYAAGLDAYAKELTEITEQVHDELSIREKWSPKDKTHLILVDTQDAANGYATPYYKNTIVMYLTKPRAGTTLSNYRSWLHLLFRHEYTHTLNIDQLAGVPLGLQNIAGRYYFPNLFLPIFAIEGNAVYNESDTGRFGRNNSALVDMYLRTDFIEGKPKTLVEATGYAGSWPYGSVPYLYGGMFQQYLAKRYGEESIKEIFRKNSDDIIPFRANSSYKEVYGKTAEQLWDEYIRYLQEKYDGQQAEIQRLPVTQSRRLTTSASLTNMPRFVSEGTLAYIERDYKKKAGLYHLDISSGRRYKISGVHSPTSYAKNGKGYMVVDYEYHKTYSLYAELFQTDTFYTKLSSELHALSIDSRNGESLLITRDKHYYSLHKMSGANTAHLETLIDHSTLYIDQCRISPDAKRAVFVFKERNGDTGLALINLQSGNVQTLLRDAYENIYPSWHPDGKRIIFSSDRSGVFNLYELRVGGTTLKQLTNLETGAFSSDLSFDGKQIAFTSYTASGYDIFLCDYPAEGLSRINLGRVKAALFFETENDRQFAEKEISSRPYNAFAHANPVNFYPVLWSELVADESYDTILGAGLFGSDPLYHHYYNSYAALNLIQPKLNIAASYTYGALYPDLSLSYFDDTLFYGEDQFPRKESSNDVQRRLTREALASISATHFQYDFGIQATLAYGYSYEYVSNYTAAQSETEDIAATAESSDSFWINNSYVGSSLLFSSAAQYVESPGLQDGFEQFVELKLFSPYVGAEEEYYLMMGGAKYYTPPLFFHHIAALGASGGYIHNVNTDIRSFSLGRLSKGRYTYHDETEKTLGIRGYGEGEYIGSRIASATAEYKFPILMRDLGSGLFPLTGRRIWGLLFFEAASVWEGEYEGDIRRSVGAELNLLTSVGYRFDLEGFVGYARGLDEGGEQQVYFGIRSLFDRTFMRK